MVYLHRLLEALLMPPAPNLLGLALGLLLLGRRPRLGRWLIGASALLLYLASIPALVHPVVNWADSRLPPISPADLAGVQAIVVPGAGRREHALEYGADGDTVSRIVMERLRYAAWLHRRTGLPVLVSGGRVFEKEPHSEAELMAGFLRELGVEARWQEGRSRTTWENAVFSTELLRADGIGRIALVTHGLHMPRALWAFRRQGLEVIPAPTVVRDAEPLGGVADFIPGADALEDLVDVLHEWLGLLWYRLRYARP